MGIMEEGRGETERKEEGEGGRERGDRKSSAEYRVCV
jgi:hypothetical protein